MLTQPYLVSEPVWLEVKDGNDNARAMFDRHYSRKRYADGRKPLLFLGPGEKMVLIMADGSAVCAWRKFIDDCIDQRTGEKQQGVNCAIFRREHGGVASDQLTRAMTFATRRWGPERLYTYIDPLEVPPTFRASRPTWGHCFYQAGWTYAGLTRDRKHVLEFIASAPPAQE